MTRKTIELNHKFKKIYMAPPGWFTTLYSCLILSIAIFLVGVSILDITWITGLIFMILWFTGWGIITNWTIQHPRESRAVMVPDIEEDKTEYIEPTHTNGIPQELYKQGQFYATEKSTLSSRYAALDTILQADISNIGMSNATIQNIYEHIGVFQSSIVRSSDALIHILPEDMDILEDFENRAVFYRYLDYVQHEMNSIQQISRDMTSTIQTWMVYNHIEVQQEKQKMEQLLAEGHDKISGYMSTLLVATETLRARGDEKQVEQILVRQRI